MKKYRVNYSDKIGCGEFTIKSKNLKNVFKQLSEIFIDNKNNLNINIVQINKKK